MPSRGASASPGRPKRDAKFWPDEQQGLLLRAALLPAREALAAWRELRPHLDVERLDSGSRRLLPLLALGLRRHGVDDPRLAPMERLYAQTSLRNALLFERARAILAGLATAGLPTIVLKGVPLVLRYYRDPGLRPMADVDVLVRCGDVAPALEVLGRLGFRPSRPVTSGFVTVKHAVACAGPGGTCDLHWRVFEEPCPPAADEELWAAARPLLVAGAASLALDPADELLHVCVHGAKWSPTPPIRWVADAMLILRSAPIDWARVVAQARRRRFVLRIRGALAYLRHALEAPVPAEVLASLGRLPVSPLERLDGWAYGGNRRGTLLGELPIYVTNYLRSHGSREVATLLGFPRYLGQAWGVESAGGMAGGALRRAARRVRRIVVSRLVAAAPWRPR